MSALEGRGPDPDCPVCHGTGEVWQEHSGFAGGAWEHCACNPPPAIDRPGWLDAIVRWVRSVFTRRPS